MVFVQIVESESWSDYRRLSSHMMGLLKQRFKTIDNSFNKILVDCSLEEYLEYKKVRLDWFLERYPSVVVVFNDIGENIPRSILCSFMFSEKD